MPPRLNRPANRDPSATSAETKNSVRAAAPNSVSASMNRYLQSVSLSRSANTARTYRQALAAFSTSLQQHGVDPAAWPAGRCQEDWVARFAADLKVRSPATERLYLTAAAGWYEYLAAEQIADVNLARVHLLIRQRGRRPGQRLPQFPRDAIEQVLQHVSQPSLAADPIENLRRLRDRSFLLTLADTGLRVHEACSLRRGTWIGRRLRRY